MMAGRATAIFGWLVVVAAQIAFWLQAVGTPSRLVAVIQALTPWGVPVVAAVAMVSAIARRKALAVGGALLALGFAPLTAAMYSHRSDVELNGLPVHRITTSNVLYDNPEAELAFDAVSGEGADVVVLWEMTRALRSALDGHDLARQYEYRYDDPAGIGLVVLSDYPLHVESWLTSD